MTQIRSRKKVSMISAKSNNFLKKTQNFILNLVETFYHMKPKILISSDASSIVQLDLVRGIIYGVSMVRTCRDRNLSFFSD